MRALSPRTDATLYLEVAAVVTTFILAGRYFEARAKRQSGAALRALLDMGAKDVAVLRDGAETRIPVGQLAVGDVFVVRPGEKIATDGVVDRRRLGGRRLDGHRRIGARRSRPRRRRRRRDGERRRACSTFGPPRSAPTPSSPRWRGSSPTRRTARPTCSGWPTGCRRSSCRSSSGCPLLTLAGWLVAGRSAIRRVHRRRRRADHRVPVRPRTGHADRAAGRNRTWRAARHPDQGSAGARVDPARRHDRARQDRHGDDRPHDGVAVHAADDARRPVLRLAGALENASEHPIARAIAAHAADSGPLPAVTDFVNHGGRGVTGVVDGHARRGRTPVVAARAVGATAPADFAPPPTPPKRRADRRCGWRSTARSAR